MPAADVVFSPSGELLAAVPPLVFSDPTDNIAVWNVDEPGEPVMRLSLAARGFDRRATLDSMPPGWVCLLTGRLTTLRRRRGADGRLRSRHRRSDPDVRR